MTYSTCGDLEEYYKRGEAGSGLRRNSKSLEGGNIRKKGICVIAQGEYLWGPVRTSA